MLPSPPEVEQIILQAVAPLPSEDCPLMRAHGRVLRTPIRADRAMPPFDRVTMDGYAVRSAALTGGARRLRVRGVQAAGMRPLALTEDDDCIEIATGAVLPSGADAVVPYEETERGGEDAGANSAGGAGLQVRIAADADVTPGRNIHRRGSDAAAGDVLVPAGVRLGGGEIAVAAACGAAHVCVATRPSVAVVATGDELVEVDAADLAPHQIRKSNDYALRAALLLSERVARVERLHLRDLRSEIEQGLRRILAEFDVVLLTGGVSKGKFDFLPQVLAELGVRRLVSGVAQRPGKPMWFGMSPRQTPVFALPGNPVSAYTCLHRYVLPALGAMAGLRSPEPERVALGEAVTFKPPLTYLLPVVLRSMDDGRLTAAPTPFNTSGDLGGLVGTSGFVELPAGAGHFVAGTVARLWRWV